MQFYGKRKITLNYAIFINIKGSWQCLQIKTFMSDFSSVYCSILSKSVHFLMTFCKNSSRTSCQMIFVNKHRLQSCLCPFKYSLKSILRKFYFGIYEPKQKYNWYKLDLKLVNTFISKISYILNNLFQLYFWTPGPRKATEGVGTMAPLVEKMWGHFFILRAIEFSVGAIILYLLCFDAI